METGLFRIDNEFEKKSVWWDMGISMRWYGKLCSGMVFWQAGVLSPIFILKREI